MGVEGGYLVSSALFYSTIRDNLCILACSFEETGLRELRRRQISKCLQQKPEDLTPELTVPNPESWAWWPVCNPVLWVRLADPWGSQASWPSQRGRVQVHWGNVSKTRWRVTEEDTPHVHLRPLYECSHMYTDTHMCTGNNHAFTCKCTHSQRG